MKLLLIDLDNTILSFDETVRDGLRRGFAEFGLPPYTQEAFRAFSETTDELWRQLEEGKIVFEDIKRIRFSMIFGKLGISFDGPEFERYFREYMMTSAFPEPGAPAMLSRLQGHFILCAASNGPHTQQLTRLETAGMRQYFDYVFTSESMGAQKPTREFFDACFAEIRRRHGVSPADAAIIGDSITSDISGGIACGIHTVFYNAKHKTYDASLPIDRVVYSLDEITPAFLNEIM